MSYRYESNPYDQRGDVPATQPFLPQSTQYNQNQYNQNRYNAPVIGRDEYGGPNVEMQRLATSGAQYGRQQGTNAILQEINEINDAIADFKKQVDELEKAQKQALYSVDSSRALPEVDKMSAQIMSSYRSLIDTVKAFKRKPESLKYPQLLEKIENGVKVAMQKYKTVDNNFAQDLEKQAAREYRLVRPDATEAEVAAAVADPDRQPIFQQALMQSDRRGQATTALSAVKSRHNEIQKIAEQMAELGELFQQMEEMVVQQDVAVANIEMKGEEVVEHLDKGNEQIVTAIKSAQNARKWKWWCLGISILIIVVIVVVILIYKFVIQGGTTTVVNKTGSKRFVLPSSVVLPRGLDWKAERAVAAIPEKRGLAFKA